MREGKTPIYGASSWPSSTHRKQAQPGAALSRPGEANRKETGEGGPWKILRNYSRLEGGRNIA